MWHSGQQYNVDPSKAVVSRISPGLGLGFFSFGAFFFFFFFALGDIMILGVVVVATATAVVCAISDSFFMLSAEYLRK